MAHKSYRVLVGLNYPPNGKGTEKRAEPGDVVDDLPASSVAGLVEDGSIELVLATGGAISPDTTFYIVGESGPESVRQGGEQS